LPGPDPHLGRIVVIGRDPVFFGNVEPGGRITGKSQAMRAIQAGDHIDHPIGPTVVVGIGQGDNLARRRHAHQHGAPRVKGHDPGARQAIGKKSQCKFRRIRQRRLAPANQDAGIVCSPEKSRHHPAQVVPIK
jgi:hypothetical protein